VAGHRLTTSQRGYGTEHQPLRKRVAGVVAKGNYCVRCGRPILPGQVWHLDHRDDRKGYLCAAHARCSERAGRGEPTLAPQPRARALEWFDA